MTCPSHSITWMTAALAGGITALATTWIGDEVGALLETATSINLRSWELAAIQIAFVNVPAGLLAGTTGAMTRRWFFGLISGLLLHAAIFAAFLLTSDSFRAAPISVVCWSLYAGVLAGACAGAIGGLIGQLASAREAKEQDAI